MLPQQTPIWVSFDHKCHTLHSQQPHMRFLPQWTPQHKYKLQHIFMGPTSLLVDPTTLAQLKYTPVGPTITKYNIIFTVGPTLFTSGPHMTQLVTQHPLGVH